MSKEINESIIYRHKRAKDPLNIKTLFVRYHEQRHSYCSKYIVIPKRIN